MVTPACAACGARLTAATVAPPAISAPMIAQIFFIYPCSPQLNWTPACAACGAKLTRLIPNPPAINAPIIANIFFMFVFLSS